VSGRFVELAVEFGVEVEFEEASDEGGGVRAMWKDLTRAAW